MEEQQVFDCTCLSRVSLTSILLASSISPTLRSNLILLLPDLESLSWAALSSPSGCFSVAARVSFHRNVLKIHTFFFFIVLGEEFRQEHPAGGSKVEVFILVIYLLYFLSV